MADSPSSDLVGQVRALAGAESLGGLDDAGLVDLLTGLEDLKAVAAAAQARAAHRLRATRVAERAAAGVHAARRDRGVAAEVALARRESPHAGARELGLARALVEEMPHTMAALESGALSEWRATILVRETAHLAAEHRAAVDAELLADPARPGRSDPDRVAGWGDRRLAAEARRVGYRLDPHAAVKRNANATADRCVSLRPAPDTMSRLGALLPVAQGVAVWATLGREADRLRAAGDARTRGQLMADTLIARILHGQARPDQPHGDDAPPPAPIAVNLTVSEETLLGGGHEPGWLERHGPVPAGLARHLVAGADAAGLATLRRLYACPTTGQLVAMDSLARAFPAGLARFIDLRDRACRTPWCDAPVRHHDHAQDFADGGQTSASNGQGLCEACNHAKQAPGWHTHPTDTGPAPPVETTTPTGHHHTSRPPRLPTTPPAPTPRPTRGERALVDIIWNHDGWTQAR